ncbi:O-antigen ligase family protein [Rathayibacter sp. YIM 133350]|uniref:O-antigen ligase family protein n=1 Tax=Rathayibacter sp. YIM 133350 TaxID=3131992 RepID=UPI00307D5CF9
MNPQRSRLLVRLLASWSMFFGFAGQFLRNLIGWWGYGIVGAITIVAVVIALLVLKPRMRARRVPKSLVAFLLFAAASIAWSYYPGASAAAVGILFVSTLGGVFLGLCLTWRELVRTFGVALRWILGLSLLFEFWVAVIIRQPVLPNFMDLGDPPYPKAFYWSRGLLLHGGPIEGIVGNRNLLAFVALMALIVFAIQVVSREGRRPFWSIFGLAIAALVFVLTRSTTVILAAIAVAVVLGFALWARAAHPDRRRPVYLSAVGLVVVLGVSFAVFSSRLLALFGKSEDLTGRTDIWNTVIGLAQQRPVVGWGWISYWAPWVEPFAHLAERKGVVYLQAHNAWLDVWMQLGVIGVVLFLALVLSTLWRSWFTAIDRPRHGLASTEPYTASALLPLLLMAALLAQSLAESRILIEGGWITLVTLCLLTKRSQSSAEPMP